MGKYSRHTSTIFLRCSDRLLLPFKRRRSRTFLLYMHHFVTGVAGFIGSQLADVLLASGERVSGVDDYSLGRPQHLDSARLNPRFRFYERDVSRTEETIGCLRAASEWEGLPDIIWHL